MVKPVDDITDPPPRPRIRTCDQCIHSDFPGSASEGHCNASATLLTVTRLNPTPPCIIVKQLTVASISKGSNADYCPQYRPTWQTMIAGTKGEVVTLAGRGGGKSVLPYLMKIAVLEAQRDALLAALQKADHSPKCAVRDRDAFDD